jgi:hypothetical protein
MSPARIAAIVQLAFDDDLAEPALVPLRGHQAFAKLSRSMFRFVVDDPAVQLRDLDFLTRLARAVPAHELRRPRRLDGVAACVDRLGELVRAAGRLA